VWVSLLLLVASRRPVREPPFEEILVEVSSSRSLIVRLPASATVDDALLAAGLPRNGSDAPLSNGSRVKVGQNGVSVQPSDQALAMGQRLALNSASAGALDALPGIGPVRAKAIVGSRSIQGPFSSLQDLARVHGIGPATIKKVEPFVIGL
jgi:competence protein ComEA